MLECSFNVFLMGCLNNPCGFLMSHVNLDIIFKAPIPVSCSSSLIQKRDADENFMPIGKPGKTFEQAELGVLQYTVTKLEELFCLCPRRWCSLR